MPGEAVAIEGLAALEARVTALGPAAHESALSLGVVSNTFGELARTLGPLVGGGYLASSFQTLTRGLQDGRAAAGGFAAVLLQSKDAADKMNREVGQLNASLGATTYTARTYVQQLQEVRKAYGEAGAQLAGQLLDRFAQEGIKGVTTNNLKIATAIAMAGGDVQQAYMSVYEPMYRQLGMSLDEVNRKFFVMEKVARDTGLPVGDVTRDIVQLATQMRAFGWTINDAIGAYAPYSDALKKQQLDLREVSANIEGSFRRFVGGGVQDSVRNLMILQEGFTRLPVEARKSMDSVAQRAFGKGFQQLGPEQSFQWAQMYGQQYGYGPLQQALVASQVGTKGGGAAGTLTMDQALTAGAKLGMSAADVMEQFRLIKGVKWGEELNSLVKQEGTIVDERQKFYATEADRQKRYFEDTMTALKGFGDQLVAVGADAHTTSRLFAEMNLFMGIGGSGLMSVLGPTGRGGGGLAGLAGAGRVGAATSPYWSTSTPYGAVAFPGGAAQGVPGGARGFLGMGGASGAAGLIQAVSVVAMGAEVGLAIGRILEPLVTKNIVGAENEAEQKSVGRTSLWNRYVQNATEPYRILASLTTGGVGGAATEARQAAQWNLGMGSRERIREMDALGAQNKLRETRGLPAMTGPGAVGKPAETIVTVNIDGVRLAQTRVAREEAKKVVSDNLYSSPFNTPQI